MLRRPLEPKCPCIDGSPSTPTSRCISATRTVPGNADPMRTLLRQYFPKSTDLRVYTPDDLLAAAAQLNSRPRKTLNWDTPAQRLDMLINANK